MKNFPSYRVVPIIPAWFPYAATAFIIWVFVKKKYVDQDGSIQPLTLARHEYIHLAQQRELLYVPFFALYLLEFIIRLLGTLSWRTAYRAISFEQEARAQQEHPITERKPYGWFVFLADSIWAHKLKLILVWVVFCAIFSGWIFDVFREAPEPQSFTLSTEAAAIPTYIDTIPLARLVRQDKENQVLAKNIYDKRRIRLVDAVVVDIQAHEFITESAIVYLSPDHPDFIYDRVSATMSNYDASILKKDYVYSFMATIDYGFLGLSFKDVEPVR